ncbi:MAG: hypothetical protein Q9174_006156, partial [Haloplaca sp. 1 TL-2023]
MKKPTIALFSLIPFLSTSLPLPEYIDTLALPPSSPSSLTPTIIDLTSRSLPPAKLNPSLSTPSALRPLRADQINYQVPGTHTYLVLRKSPGGRRMPELECLQILARAKKALQVILEGRV